MIKPPKPVMPGAIAGWQLSLALVLGAIFWVVILLGPALLWGLW
jgi:hypothetical protein